MIVKKIDMMQLDAVILKIKTFLGFVMYALISSFYCVKIRKINYHIKKNKNE